MNEIITAKNFVLPNCPIPRPGEKVIYYSAARPVLGELKGHNRFGNAIIVNQFKNSETRTFETIRPHDPINRQPASWHFLPPHSKIYKPTPSQSNLFEKILNESISPGPSYMELFKEIWARGFEVFLVGGTVRDVICGQPANDVDISTTMPLKMLKKIIPSMYQQNDAGDDMRGYIRVGGRRGTNDPFIDLKVFSSSNLGTENALFGVDLKKDSMHRDFTCNSLYFDPINNAIIDPCGSGLDDAKDHTLNIICETGEDSQLAQIFIRTIKFHLRGFVISDDTLLKMQDEMIPCIPTMAPMIRKKYLATQILGKEKTIEGKRYAISQFQEFFNSFDLDHIYFEHFDNIIRELEGDLNE